jgi:hypothetical protein
MARPRHSLEEAQLTGYADRMTPQQIKERRRAEEAGLTPEQLQEVQALDGLIAAAIEQCKRGPKIRGKKNLAFQNLAILVKTRKAILEGKQRHAPPGAPIDPLEAINAQIADMAKEGIN